MISPNQDKKQIKEILVKDAYISEAGFNEENIKTTKASADVVSLSQLEQQIFISMGIPEETNSEFIKSMTYDITIGASRETCSDMVDSVAEQVIALLHGKRISNGHTLYLLDPPIELASDPSIYIVEISFYCQGAVLNTVRK